MILLSVWDQVWNFIGIPTKKMPALNKTTVEDNVGMDWIIEDKFMLMRLSCIINSKLRFLML